MYEEEVIMKVIVKTSRKSIDTHEREGPGDRVFNFHEGNSIELNDRIIGKIIREITTSLLEKGELPF